MELKRVVIYSLLIVFVLFIGYELSGYHIDNSQTVVESKENGAPQIDYMWSVKEYKSFFNYLSAIPNNVDYPMMSSKKSGALFKQFIHSTETLSNNTSSAVLAFKDVAKQKNIFQKILKLYVNKDNQISKYGNEIAYLYGIQLQFLLKMQSLAKQSLEALGKDDDSYDIKVKGFDLLKKGTALQIMISLHLMSETEFFEDNKILLSYFKRYVPELSKNFSNEGKEIIKSKIFKTSEKLEVVSTKKLLNEIIEIL